MVRRHFVLVLGIILGTYWLFVVQAGGEQRSETLRRRLSVNNSKGAGKPRMLRHAAAEPVSLTGRRAAEDRHDDCPLRQKMQHAGLNIDRWGDCAGSSVLRACRHGFVDFLVFGCGVGLHRRRGCLLAPFLLHAFKVAKRLRKFEEQFPEAIELMARALRAGHAFTTGLQNGRRRGSRSGRQRNSV